MEPPSAPTEPTTYVKTYIFGKYKINNTFSLTNFPFYFPDFIKKSKACRMIPILSIISLLTF